jgi:hypothetical protein
MDFTLQLVVNACVEHVESNYFQFEFHRESLTS